jgi:hypothetical protein
MPKPLIPSTINELLDCCHPEPKISFNNQNYNREILLANTDLSNNKIYGKSWQ